MPASPMISYAQNREDVLLHRVFPDAAGFFIDVGAADPEEYSVTKWFSDRGWTGINIEPQAGYFAALTAARPRDLNLNIGVSDRAGTMTLFEAPDRPGWTTMEPGVAAGYRKQGIEVVERVVPVLTLAEVCEQHVRGPIDFLKVDVEGHEGHVLRGADFTRWRPRVLVVEATEVGSPTPRFADWEPVVLAADYRFAAFDGLNRFYVRAEDESLLSLFAAPVNVFDIYLPAELVRCREQGERNIVREKAEIGRLNEVLAARERELEHLRQAIVELDARMSEANALLEAKSQLLIHQDGLLNDADREARRLRDQLARAERARAKNQTAYETAHRLLRESRVHLEDVRAELYRTADVSSVR